MAEQQKPKTTYTRVHPFAAKMRSADENILRQMLIYGPARSGKTTFVGSAAFDKRTSPVIVLDFEGGSNSLAGTPNEKLTVARITDWKDFNEAYDYLSRAGHGFRTVVVDSLSETHIFSLLSVIEFEVAKTNAKGDRTRDDSTAEQSDYGKSMIQIRRLIRRMRDLPMHCIFTALPKSAKVAREGIVQMPAMFGQLSEEIVGMFEVTAYMASAQRMDKAGQPTDEVTRTLYLQNTVGVRAGIRTRLNLRLPDKLENPTMTKLLDLLEGKLSTKQEKA